MLRSKLSFLRGRGLLKLLLEFVVRATTKKWHSSREIRNMIQKFDLELSGPSLVLKTERATDFVKNPLIYVDIGARGGAQDITKEFLEVLHFVFCEADEDEAKNLTSNFSAGQFSIIKNAISDSPSVRTLYLTKSRGASSLLTPNGNFIGFFGGADRDISRFAIEKEVQVETLPLSLSMPQEIDVVDILKIDVQGLEFEVLSGMGSFRPFVICTECSTTEFYLGQKTLFSVGLLLENLGYMPLRLMQITIVPKTLANFQSCIQAHGDVIFVPDNSANGRAIIERDVEKWFAALCMHGYMDFALWQIEELKISKPALITQTEELLRKS